MNHENMTSVIDQNLTKDMSNHPLRQDFVSVGYYINIETRRSILHSHPFFELILIRKGTPRYLINDSWFVLHPDELLLISPDVMHAVFCEPINEDYERIIIQITSENMEQILSSAGLEERIGNIPQHFIIPAEAVYKWNILSLIKRINLSNSVSDFYLHKMLYKSQLMELMLIIELISRTEQPILQTASSTLAADAVRYVQDCFRDSSLTVEQIAQHYFVSREHLSRVFKEYAGESLSMYIKNIRMQEFCQSLLSGKSILQACLESGFSDYSSFVKSFKKTFGITPKEYRKHLNRAVEN